MAGWRFQAPYRNNCVRHNMLTPQSMNSSLARRRSRPAQVTAKTGSWTATSGVSRHVHAAPGAGTGRVAAHGRTWRRSAAHSSAAGVSAEEPRAGQRSDAMCEWILEVDVLGKGRGACALRVPISACRWRLQLQSGWWGLEGCAGDGLFWVGPHCANVGTGWGLSYARGVVVGCGSGRGASGLWSCFVVWAYALWSCRRTGRHGLLACRRVDWPSLCQQG